MCINDIISEKRNIVTSNYPDSSPFATRKKIISYSLAFEYAYNQMLFSHALFPGQNSEKSGGSSTILAIRKIDEHAYKEITGETVGEKYGSKEFLYEKEKALLAESWSVVGAARDQDQIYGKNAIYTKNLPVYAILTSIFAQIDKWNPCQKELVLMPLVNIPCTAITYFDNWKVQGMSEMKYVRNIVLPEMKKQYGENHEFVIKACEKWIFFMENGIIPAIEFKMKTYSDLASEATEANESLEKFKKSSKSD
ncbi:MAG: hypothetical protein LBI56_04500 [Puniceicoccales bacterium]|nr:hypothetical protein [Puniceicoccales bacterium]